MNLAQLEYIIAVDKHRQFVKAADACFVTQATLSMMIRKLEEELDIRIFDRSRQPVVPTEDGKRVIEQARVILHEAQVLRDITSETSGPLTGEIRLGVIPTLAPYLLPLFLHTFLKKHPGIRMHVSEFTTDEIIRKLERNELDAGLLAVPLNDTNLHCRTLFYEEFMVYASPEEKLMKKQYILPADIDVNRLWLLEEGHCLRSQVINLCELKEREKGVHQLDFAAGSIETLKTIVDINNGITIIPALAVHTLSSKQQKNLRRFKSPAPVREIGLVTYRPFMKERLMKVLEKEILASVPDDMKIAKRKEIISLD